MVSIAGLMSHDLHLLQGMDKWFEKRARNKVILVPHYWRFSSSFLIWGGLDIHLNTFDLHMCDPFTFDDSQQGLIDSPGCSHHTHFTFLQSVLYIVETMA